MTEQQQLLAAIISNPDDDTVRLVYADWLEEHDDPHRAAFIRAQIEYAKYERVVLSVSDAKQLACDYDVCQYLMQSPYTMRELYEGQDPNNPTYMYGLPRSLYGIELVVNHNVNDSGMTTLDHFRKLANHPKRRELEILIKEAIGPHGYGAYGHRWWEWFGHYQWGNNWESTRPTRAMIMRRGFVESVTCTAEDWFKHADEVWWHPEKMVMYDETGKGHVRWTCPLTAQPLRKVVMTTSPVVRYEITHFDSGNGNSNPDTVKIVAIMTLGPHLIEAMWQGRVGYMQYRAERVLSRREIAYSLNLDSPRLTVEDIDRELSPKRLLGEWFKGVEFELQGYNGTTAILRGFPDGIMPPSPIA